MLYSRLAEYYDRLAATTKRLEMTDILVELVREVEPTELPLVVYLTQGKLAADFHGVELGVAEKLVLRVLVDVTGLKEEHVVEKQRETGDLGDAAEALVQRAREGKPKKGPGSRSGPRAARQVTLFEQDPGHEEEPLTVARVHAAFLAVSAATGAGSQEHKTTMLRQLLLTADPRSARYLVRTVTGRLRLGVADMTLLDALAVAFATKDERPVLERAYNVSSDLGAVARELARGGLAAVRGMRLAVGVPIRPMLAERLPDAAQILEKLGGRGAVEWKYDGLRMQAHIPAQGEVRLYSRRLEDLTDQFPDVAKALRERFAKREAIVEGEAVPVVPGTGEIRPFQDIAGRRGRKHGLTQAIEDIPVTIFLFDCLLLDGQDLTGLPQAERRQALESAFAPGEGVAFSRYVVVETTDALERLFLESVDDGSEGIMVKSVGEDSGYRAGARGWQWIKFKREYRAELADSLDLVVVGAFAGRGRRKGWYGALLMAAYNEDEDVFETVCKLGTGFDDPLLASMPEKFAQHKLEQRHARVRSGLEADWWFAPAIVAEVRGAELTLSPVHVAGKGAFRPDSGLAVRFPRFTGRWRDDKAPEDATTTGELVEMYKSQRRREETPEQDS